MSLTIYNTLTRRKENFQPLEPGKVKMYCCGVTVYDYCHLGHARSYIVWDTVRRYLKFSGYEVHYLQNFTDIDDKILNRANAENTSMEEVSQKYIQAYFEDIRRLNVIDASEYPRVTENITSIHQLIAELERKDYAYAVNGDVYYKTDNFSEYGKLSGKQLEDMQAGASGRVDLEDLSGKKKHKPSDFALWKAAKPGEPAWESPWGMGRPGWHIECSAMIRANLGETIDIHGGGGDLVFPHHENEIAQSEVVTGKPLANYWVHNGMVTVDGVKMSKSLGNFTTIRELLDRPIDPMVIRLFVLQGHYRKPLDFTEDAISSAQNSWETLKTGLLFRHQYGEKHGRSSPSPRGGCRRFLCRSPSDRRDSRASQSPCHNGYVEGNLHGLSDRPPSAWREGGLGCLRRLWRQFPATGAKHRGTPCTVTPSGTVTRTGRVSELYCLRAHAR